MFFFFIKTCYYYTFNKYRYLYGECKAEFWLYAAKVMGPIARGNGGSKEILDPSSDLMDGLNLIAYFRSYKG